MAGDTPTWLDKTFLTPCLHEDDKLEIIVLNFQVIPAVEGGSNYASTLFRVKVNFKRGNNGKLTTKSLIVKAPLETGILKELLINETNVNNKEVVIYNEMLPKINKELGCQIAPLSYPCSLTNVLVLEDLNDKGYTMGDRLTQLDFLHCKQFVITLAKFHAASVFLLRKDPQEIESFGEEIYYSKAKPSGEILQLFIPTCLKSFATAIEKIKGCEKFAKVIRSVTDSIWDTVVEIFKPRNTFNVINHGDAWTNNVMFKHDESGNVVDVKLIDFQLCRYTSPTLDLLYFIWSSASSEVRRYKLQELYEAYLLTLNNTLQELGCPESYSSEDFENDMKVSSPFCLVMVCSFLPMVTYTDPVDIDDLFNIDVLKNIEADINADTNTLMKFFKPESFKILLPEALHQLDQLGILENVMSR